MRIKYGLKIMILGVMALVFGGCGMFSSAPTNQVIPVRQSILMSSHNLKEWHVTMNPDLSFMVRYVGAHALQDPVYTLLTKTNQEHHWHQVYTTGVGMVQYRSFSSGNTSNNRFVGRAKLVLTWKIGKKPDSGYTVYRIRSLKK